MAEATAVEVTMPEMGESVTEGTVLEWHVAVGDTIEEGETLVEVSTDKVDAEVPAPVTGTVTELRAEVDDEIAVGAVLAVIDPDAGGSGPSTTVAAGEGDADLGDSATPKSSSAPNGSAAADDSTSSNGASADPIEVTMPEMGESVTEGTVLEWHVAVGDTVEEGQTLVEVSTDKVDAEVPAPAAGEITELLVEPDQEIPIGAALCRMIPGAGSGGAGNGSAPAAAEGAAPAAPGATDAGDGRATPVAKQIGRASCRERV